MIERHDGALLDGAHAGIAGRLDALEEQCDQRRFTNSTTVAMCGK